jgi:hypothetical protein
VSKYTALVAGNIVIGIMSATAPSWPITYFVDRPEDNRTFLGAASERVSEPTGSAMVADLDLVLSESETEHSVSISAEAAVRDLLLRLPAIVPAPEIVALENGVLHLMWLGDSGYLAIEVGVAEFAMIQAHEKQETRTYRGPLEHLTNIGSRWAFEFHTDPVVLKSRVSNVSRSSNSLYDLSVTSFNRLFDNDSARVSASAVGRTGSTSTLLAKI